LSVEAGRRGASSVVDAAAVAPRGGRLTRMARGSRTSQHRTWFWRVVVWGGMLLGWQVIAWTTGPFYLPTIESVLVDGMGQVISSGYLLTFADSLRQLLIGFAVACAIGIPAGVLIGSSRVARDLLNPYVNTLFVTPTEALLPMIIIMFGTGLEYRVAVVVLFAFFFPLLNSAAGVAAIDRNLLETARAFCTPRWRVFRHILLPAAAPYVVAGVRLGLGMALKGMIIAELWVSFGTGGLLKNLGAFRQLDVYFALALLVVTTAVVVNGLLAAYERHLRPWQRATIGGAVG
jgi:ABC-type nitrate/sulfonate/bicarbonate transport system permease component